MHSMFEPLFITIIIVCKRFHKSDVQNWATHTQVCNKTYRHKHQTQNLDELVHLVLPLIKSEGEKEEKSIQGLEIRWCRCLLQQIKYSMFHWFSFEHRFDIVYCCSCSTDIANIQIFSSGFRIMGDEYGLQPKCPVSCVKLTKRPLSSTLIGLMEICTNNCSRYIST